MSRRPCLAVTHIRSDNGDRVWVPRLSADSLSLSIKMASNSAKTQTLVCRAVLALLAFCGVPGAWRVHVGQATESTLRGGLGEHALYSGACAFRENTSVSN